MRHTIKILYKLIMANDQFKPGFSLFALCVLAISLTFFALSIGKPYMGLKLSLGKGGWYVESINANGLASKAGIREGDKPVEVNGQPAERFLEKYREPGMVFGMLVTELAVVDEHGQIKRASLRDSSAPWQSVIEQIMLFIVCLVFWATGFYVFLKRPRNLAALLLCLAGLDFGLSMSANAAAGIAVPTALWVEVATAIIGPWLLVHFFLVLPEERDHVRGAFLSYLVYVPAVITLVLFHFVGYADGQSLPLFRSIRLFEYGIGFLTATVLAVFNYFRASTLRTKQQMKIVLIGCLAAIIPFLLLNILPEVIWGQTIIPSGFGILLIIFIPLAMGYAVVTRRLMDIDVIVRRGVVYGFITLIMAVILSVGIALTVTFQKSLDVPEEIFIALVLGGVATALFGPIRSGVEVLVDRLFYKDRYDYRQIVHGLSTSLNSMRDLIKVSRLVVSTTVQTLNLAGGCLFAQGQSKPFELRAAQGIFMDERRQLRLLSLISRRDSRIEFPNSASGVDADVAFLIPLVEGEKEIGVLCLAQKLSRQDFSSDDIYLLQGVAAVAAIALHRALLIRDASARDTFVSVASHELRTPLTSIMGYTDLLLRRNPPDATRERWLKNILDSGHRITAMVDDLLNVTRINSGKVNLKKEKVRLPDILQERLSMVRESTEKHEFVVDIEPGLPDVLVDHDKFGQVIGNLLSNAVKYSRNGGRVTLAAYSDIKQHRVVVSVADQGIGISPEDQGSLFTTFHRIQRPETEGIRGSGLGLYIAKEWTEAMGGEIWVESDLNKGSTFFIAIPVSETDEGVNFQQESK